MNHVLTKSTHTISPGRRPGRNVRPSGEMPNGITYAVTL